MSPIVCQGIQSCLEPCVLRHKNAEFGSFIQSPTNISHNQNELMTEKEKVYVHPLSQRSSSPTLSKKSLEMCTESLGCETGSDISERSDEFSLISSKSEYYLSKLESISRESRRKLIPTCCGKNLGEQPTVKLFLGLGDGPRLISRRPAQ